MIAYYEEVEALISEGYSFEKIEETIDEWDIPPDHKSACWLLAWSERPRSERHEILTMFVG